MLSKFGWRLARPLSNAQVLVQYALHDDTALYMHATRRSQSCIDVWQQKHDLQATRL